MKFELTVTDEVGAKATVRLYESHNWIELIDQLQKGFIPAESHPLYHFYKGEFSGKERRMERVIEELAEFIRWETCCVLRDMINIDNGRIKGYSIKWTNKVPTEQNRLDLD